MTEEKERYELERRPEVQLGMLAVAPEKVIAEGSRIATALAEIINSRRLYTQIGKKKYVHVDGWNTMGAMIGVLPKEEYVTKLEDGYEAGVLLIRVSDGMEVGRGTAICMRDERNWKTRDEYAIRSMAITRATGKAFRIGFSWILKLAGFEPTPAEEMPMAEPQVIEAEVKKVEPDNKDLFGSSIEEPKKPNGTRPYKPEICRERILDMVPNYKGARKDEERPGGTLVTYIAWQMNECFGGDDNADGKRIGVLNYIFGPTKSTKDLNGAQLKAIERWLEVKEWDGAGAGWFPRKEARLEAATMFAAHLKEQGQQELEV